MLPKGEECLCLEGRAAAVYSFFLLLVAASIILTAAGLRRMFETSSKRKLPPTSTKSIYLTISPPKLVAEAHPARVSMKNIAQPMRKIPVLTIGQTTAAIITAI